MRKFSLIAFATVASLSLAACGSADDASEDAQADTVEMPADAALTNTPDPAANAAAATDSGAVADAAEDAADDAESNSPTDDAADAAAAAAADATAAADAAAGDPPVPDTQGE